MRVLCKDFNGSDLYVLEITYEIMKWLQKDAEAK